MNKKLIVSLIIIFIVIAAGLLFYVNQNAASHSSSNIQTTSVATSTGTTNQSSSQTRVSSADDFSINDPHGLILVDAQGRRTGEDPATGVIYTEIPGTTYDNSGARSVSVDFSAPQNGTYRLYVIGGASGAYNLESTIFHGGPGVKYYATGTIEEGQVISYIQNFDLNNPASTTLIYQGPTSLINIISTPPNNLPPPPVP
jgi:hypothetical protein